MQTSPPIVKSKAHAVQISFVLEQKSCKKNEKLFYSTLFNFSLISYFLTLTHTEIVQTKFGERKRVENLYWQKLRTFSYAAFPPHM